MSDPKPTIRLTSCRQAGRCPECKEPSWRNLASDVWVVTLACGCHPCSNWHCNAAHLGALLTEALRQRDACQSGVCSKIEMLLAEVERLRHWREDESANFGMSREVCAALREERDAAIRERDEARAELQKVKLRLREVADLAESLLHRSYTVLDRCHHRLNETLSAPALRIDIEALLSEIREALPQ